MHALLILRGTIPQGHGVPLLDTVSVSKLMALGQVVQARDFCDFYSFFLKGSTDTL